MRTARLMLVGLGNVGRRFVELLKDRRDLLQERHGLDLRLVAAVDSQGAALAPEGLDLAALLEAKRHPGGVASMADAGRPGLGAVGLLEAARPELLLEASPTNYHDAQPGLGIALRALEAGSHVVLASKGPLVLGWADLASRSDRSDPSRPCLRFGGTTCGALPTLALGQRDLVAARIHRVEGVLNLSTQILLGLLGDGMGYDEAIEEARRRGLLEADPRLDLEGWDAAAKLVIVANAVLGMPARLQDVSIRGITGLDPAEVQRAKREGERYALLAVAERGDGTYRLRVGPARLAPDHPFARLASDEGAVLYDTDIYGRMMATVAGQGPLGTAAAMLRDVVGILERR